MTTHDFTTTITVEAAPQRVFDAINDVRGWWGQDVEGRTDQLGDEFVYRGENLHYSAITVTDLVPGQRVEWLVTENYMTFVEDQSEWRGTRIVFEIAALDAGTTQVRFSHLGLVPTYECFDVCSNAWTFFVRESLPQLITTGEGLPLARHAHAYTPRSA